VAEADPFAEGEAPVKLPERLMTEVPGRPEEAEVPFASSHLASLARRLVEGASTARRG